MTTRVKNPSPGHLPPITSQPLEILLVDVDSGELLATFKYVDLRLAFGFPESEDRFGEAGLKA
jgi:hypothetical protein